MRPAVRSMLRFALTASLSLVGAAAAIPAGAESGAGDSPAYLRDRGPGMRTSMFATFVQHRELLVYTFGEYYLDNNLQYTPSEFGHVGTQDYKGRYRASEGLVFMSYRITDRLAVEMEAAVITASLRKAANDPSTMPARIEESGLGDVEGQFSYRVLTETAHRPEIFSFAELVIPHSKNKELIGTSDWEGKVGAGALRGFGFGTLSARISLEYARASETPWDLGEWGAEYIRQATPAWRIYAGVEGQALDELALITEVQRVLSSHATLKAGAGFGLLSNTTDFAPEVGIIWSFPTRGR